MKKIFYLSALLSAVHFQVEAQSEKATVYLLRLAGPDDFIPYFTYLDSDLLCKVGNGRYSVHEVDPGNYKMHAQYKGKIKSNPETDLYVNFEAGNTYYIQVSISTRAFGKGKFHCDVLSEETDKELLGPSLVEDEKCF